MGLEPVFRAFPDKLLTIFEEHRKGSEGDTFRKGFPFALPLPNIYYKNNYFEETDDLYFSTSQFLMKSIFSFVIWRAPPKLSA